ncbi:lipopolysaccharide assembly protein LapB [Bacteriovorax sp. DB6_IX]|uniref:tetratricopeptide repeat protein n=1 Tax=Bacteriovorax sp. DB6_IX TaxID=1353530 RepID=UPI00038A295D|nr:hypothetical protein [Bacteriovorax sp. DB6_IX]EQC50632.1 hypothetical protein M901_0982 [Bacteriovorax sp. DB6_IX]
MVDQYDGLVDEKLLAKLEAKFGKFRILIVSSNKTMKSTFKRAFTALNFKMANIAVAEDYSEACKIIKEDAPHILVTSLYLKDDKTAMDLFAIHREYFPTSLKNFFFVTTEIEEHYISSLEHEYEFDALLQGQFSFQQYVQTFSKTLEKKLNPTKSDVLVAKVKEQIRAKEYDKGLAMIAASEDLQINEIDKLNLEADIYFKKNEPQEALKRYREVLNFDARNFNALVNTISINFSDKNYGVAYEYTQKFLENFSAPPNYLPIILKVLLFNKEYFKIIKLCKEYDQDDRIDLHVKLNIAAALALCGKSLITSNLDVATEAFERAISISGGQSFNILQMVVTSLLAKSELHEKAVGFVEKYRANFIKMNQFIALEYDVMAPRRSAQENISEGMQLINQNVKSYKIYETIITSSVKTGRRKEVIEDLVFEACKEFPDYSEQFKRYI